MEPREMSDDGFDGFLQDSHGQQDQSVPALLHTATTCEQEKTPCTRTSTFLNPQRGRVPRTSSGVKRKRTPQKRVRTVRFRSRHDIAVESWSDGEHMYDFIPELTSEVQPDAVFHPLKKRAIAKDVDAPDAGLNANMPQDTPRAKLVFSPAKDNMINNRKRQVRLRGPIIHEMCLFCWMEVGKGKLCTLPCGHVYHLECIYKCVVQRCIAKQCGSCAQTWSEDFQQMILQRYRKVKVAKKQNRKLLKQWDLDKINALPIFGSIQRCADRAPSRYSKRARNMQPD